MQVELNQIEREDLECFIYDGHKDAYGVKGRHYDFSAMSMDDLRKEADRIANAIDVAQSEEKAREEQALAEFKARITEVIELGAGNRINALRWMTSTETFYHSQSVEGWVYEQGILFTDYGRELVNELMDIVEFEEWE